MNLTLGQRVRMKRRAQDLTLRQVADAIGMSKTWVADLERGRHLPTDETLLERIGYALRDDWTALRDMALDERGHAREQALGATVRAPARSFATLEDNAAAASRTLHPIETERGEAIPVVFDLSDASGTAERLGLGRPLRFELRPWVRAEDPEAQVWMQSGEIAIALRDDVHARAAAGAGRDRLTAAHALAHAVLHADLLAAGAVLSDWPATTARLSAPRAYESPEWQANAWACAFLMPSAAARAFLARLRPGDFGVADLARHFGVSTTAAQLRLEALAPSFARSAGEVG